ncbi:putative membrane protein [Sphingobium sp. OAS761]|nr:putative membrane protein [Sphingobium sp. OAS761]
MIASFYPALVVVSLGLFAVALLFASIEDGLRR